MIIAVCLSRAWYLLRALIEGIFSTSPSLQINAKQLQHILIWLILATFTNAALDYAPQQWLTAKCTRVYVSSIQSNSRFLPTDSYSGGRLLFKPSQTQAFLFLLTWMKFLLKMWEFFAGFVALLQDSPFMFKTPHLWRGITLILESPSAIGWYSEVICRKFERFVNAPPHWFNSG